MKALFEYYLKNIPHKGKRYAVRFALKVLPFKYLKSHYGPILRVNKWDKTNIYALCGEYGYVISDHIKTLKPGCVFIDIGTNYGLFSLLASAKIGVNGNVFSFEPNPAIYGYFLDNIKQNRLGNIIPFHCAVSDSDRLIGLSFDEKHSGKSHIAEKGEFTISAFNITQWKFLAEKISTKDVHVKIDVEGYEAEILKVLSGASWFENIKSIIIEIDDDNLRSFGSTSQKDIYVPLQSAGFKPTINGKAGSHYDEIFIR